MESIFIPRYFWNGTNDEVCTNTAVLVRDNRIEQIDDPEKLRLGYPEAQVLESNDWLMMPAFVDAHDHRYVSHILPYPRSGAGNVVTGFK